MGLSFCMSTNPSSKHTFVDMNADDMPENDTIAVPPLNSRQGNSLEMFAFKRHRRLGHAWRLDQLRRRGCQTGESPFR